MIFLTNAYKEKALEYLEDSDYLPLLEDIAFDEELVLGKPKPTEVNDVEALKKFGVVGVYKKKSK